MGSKLQDSHRNVGNSLDSVLYYYNVGNDVSCHDGGGLGVADGTHDLGGCAMRWDSLVRDDLGSSSVWHLVAFCSLPPDLVIYNLYVDVEEAAQGSRAVPYGRAGVSANCYDPYDPPP